PHRQTRPGNEAHIPPEDGENSGRVILVCFLSLAIWRTLQHWIKASGLGAAPRKLLEEMREIKSLDVILPTREKKIKLRVVANAPKELKALLQRMKVLLPNRPRIIENVVQKNALI
ncbi:MAG TPA: hypothetical protein VJZ16_06445, partial [Syntrophales bacterium]|nr:hypothetical protein [Syntrophales bacterium]